MYKRFYNLRRSPFEITPDPFFLYRTRAHHEALASLYYAVRWHKGFVVLTGEVGTGKSLLVRCMLELMSRSNIAYAYVFNSRLSPLEFLRYIAADLGLAVSGKTKSEILLDLGAFAVARHQKRLTTAIVIDEAHNLSAEVLEEIRLLTNLETTQEKLLQIPLIGQPELDEKLDSIELRQLKQRIALRSQLQPLNLDETRGYIQHRLQLAGAAAQAATLFPDDTMAEVYRHSQGFPRLINTLCENALLTAYVLQVRCVTPEIIKDRAKNLRLNARPSPAPEAAGYDAELLWAHKTMIALHESLQQMRSNRVDLSSVAVAEASRRASYS
jgi:general secretion pathway protein A